MVTVAWVGDCEALCMNLVLHLGVCVRVVMYVWLYYSRYYLYVCMYYIHPM
jgi:hypothetical protein